MQKRVWRQRCWGRPNRRKGEKEMRGKKGKGLMNELGGGGYWSNGRNRGREGGREGRGETVTAVGETVAYTYLAQLQRVVPSVQDQCTLRESWMAGRGRRRTESG